ncbi:MAG: hypothetical protein HQM13_24345, partial [SAR324 cluster bacterium]|nr:hypothetical protein [SAR324 cluster bacterium]
MKLNRSMNVMNPTGGAISRPEDRPSSLPMLSLKDVPAYENIHSAWKQVKSSRGSAGIDGVSVDEFAIQTRDQWKGIKEQLSALLSNILLDDLDKELEKRG